MRTVKVVSRCSQLLDFISWGSGKHTKQNKQKNFDIVALVSSAILGASCLQSILFPFRSVVRINEMEKLLRQKLLWCGVPVQDHIVFAISASEAIKISPLLAAVYGVHVCRVLHCGRNKSWYNTRRKMFMSASLWQELCGERVWWCLWEGRFRCPLVTEHSCVSSVYGQLRFELSGTN